MLEAFDANLLARLQFAFTVSFHFIFPSFTIGLASYLWLLFCAFALLFGGLRRAVRAGPAEERVGRAAMAAAYAGLVLHTLVYAAFLEDPLSWVLLALGASLRLAGEARSRRGSPSPEPSAMPEPEPVTA